MILPEIKEEKRLSKEGKKERWAVIVLVLIFLLLLLMFVFFSPKPVGPGHSPAESPIVKQRIINLQKSR